jgi:hypothetical protein
VVDPKVLVIVVLIAVGYYAGEKAVEGVKKGGRAVAHAAKVVSTKVAHVFHHPADHE